MHDDVPPLTSEDYAIMANRLRELAASCLQKLRSQTFPTAAARQRMQFRYFIFGHRAVLMDVRFFLERHQQRRAIDCLWAKPTLTLYIALLLARQVHLLMIKLWMQNRHRLPAIKINATP